MTRDRLYSGSGSGPSMADSGSNQPALSARWRSGRGDMAVYAGCPRPILKPLETAAHVHGEDGLKGANLPAPATRSTSQSI